METEHEAGNRVELNVQVSHRKFPSFQGNSAMYRGEGGQAEETGTDQLIDEYYKDLDNDPKLSEPKPPQVSHPSTNNMSGHGGHGGAKVEPFSIDSENDSDSGIGCCGYILYGLSLFCMLITFPLSLCVAIKVVQEYERAVIFRLGRLVPGGAKGPGLFFIIPCMDSFTKVDLRTISFDVPPQEVLTRDSVTVAVDAVVYYRTSNATASITNVEDSSRSTRLLAATTLRNVLGTKSLAEILSERETISQSMQMSLDEATDPWGVKVERVEVKDVRLPLQLQRAMAAEAEASRDARAKVIAAEGEQKASRALKEAADVISESPAALQLRYLQTLNTISAEKNSTIIFPLPIDLLQSFVKK
ncbi:band 7 protein AGAP004871-like isoform X2 [Haliotis rufescens]|uniref:band 7 protein AGAP004871-like isoform X1 n=1 Tax=Haliotis rufescens TaxID=6454 RepID=UPI001EB04E47|nr:band 7 protein AGAP004871-like isoform X1 [Haliotis rufescens]XP_048237599.1 band 7 protein AGAP004871-like isoform X2 [Haliotis rufescens]